MSTPLVILLTAVLTTFGTKLIEQVFKEINDARALRKGKEKHVYRLERRVQQLLVVAEFFRLAALRNGVPIDQLSVPEELQGWDKSVDS